MRRRLPPTTVPTAIQLRAPCEQSANNQILERGRPPTGVQRLQDRVSLGGGPQRARCRDRCRVCPAEGRCHSHAGTPSVLAAKQATSVILIVFAAVGDPVDSGLVASLVGGAPEQVWEVSLRGVRPPMWHQ